MDDSELIALLADNIIKALRAHFIEFTQMEPTQQKLVRQVIKDTITYYLIKEVIQKDSPDDNG